MRTAPALLIVSLTMLALTGCIADDDPVIPAPLPTSTPIFASDEEALAAAEEAYGAYLAVSNTVTAGGGSETSSLEPLTTPEMFENLKVSIAQYSENDLHTQGESQFDSLTLQQYIDNGDGSGSVVAYVCLDVQFVRVLNAAGEDVTAPGRDERVPLEIAFAADKTSDPVLLLERSDSWSGEDFCIQE